MMRGPTVRQLCVRRNKQTKKKQNLENQFLQFILFFLHSRSTRPLEKYSCQGTPGVLLEVISAETTIWAEEAADVSFSSVWVYCCYCFVVSHFKKRKCSSEY